MKLIASVVLALFVAGTFGALLPNATGDDILPIAKKHSTTTTIKPMTTSTEAPITSTTEAPKTTSTEAPKTTSTEAPKTTSTEAPKTTSTTEAPKTTSTEAPKTTTQTPKPNDKPQIGTWTLSDKKTNETCIIVELAAQLNFTYTTNDNKQNVTTYNIPVEKTTSEGHCTNGTSDETIFVTWPAKSQNKTNTFAYTFGLKDDKKTYYLKEVVYGIFAGDLYNGNNDTLELIHNASEYATLKGYSYHCTKEQQLKLTDKSNKTIGSVNVSHVQLQAFYSSKTGKFSTAVDCESTGTPDYVPIAVGISLIALVVIVLVGYLVGRRRAQASGYVSM